MALVVITAPSVEPVTLAELKTHCRVDHDDDNAYLASAITAARQHVERFTGKTLVSTTYDLLYDEFPSGPLEIPRGPLQSVTGVYYIDATTGLEVTLAADKYEVDTASDPGWIAPGADGWPDAKETINAVRVRFVAGYGATASDEPAPLGFAIMQLAAHWYERREAVGYGDTGQATPSGADDILREHREWRF